MTLRSGTCRIADSIELPYVERGDGDGFPVVLLHAYADSWRSFERVLPHFPPWIRAVAVTQRGHGEATKPPHGYWVEDFVDDLTAFLDGIGLDRATLVASSSAGFTARRLAALRPARVTGMVLIGVPWSLGERASSLSFVETVAALADPVDPGFVRNFVEGTSSKRVPRDFLAAMTAESLKVPSHVWKQALDDLLAASPEGTDSIAVPTLILWGTLTSSRRARIRNDYVTLSSARASSNTRRPAMSCIGSDPSASPRMSLPSCAHCTPSLVTPRASADVQASTARRCRGGRRARQSSRRPRAASW
jgi:pimeloyl-ACP methyl ester carboxylesterase